ncbi:MAG: PD-(D/E)XK nuclease family protein [Candidatus Omnitrophica bacterium]|jgi:CRISPR/Cas system-associated exonuclease Cas4 (RecB family)/regulator of sigma D|nr:PD-(D/E)XK nuclease family protein [Candidatus Omnitrophota bacterium]
MGQAIFYNFGEDFIAKITEYIWNNFRNNDNDFSRIACVFSGKRPALFLRRELAKKVKNSFIPPRIFSIEEFISNVLFSDKASLIPRELDSCFLIYTLAKKYVPNLTEGRSSFKDFLPWAKEIISFIEQLDLEEIKNESLRTVEKSAQIGFEIPLAVNRLLESIVTLRQAYHKALAEKNTHSRGMLYSFLASNMNKIDLNQFDTILFCNLFYLHKTELKIINYICQKNKGICFFQGSRKDWPVLENNTKDFKAIVDSSDNETNKFNLFIFKGFDMHSQVGIIRNILDEKIIANKENTAIILPRPEAIIPLLNEISSLAKGINISMGYPLSQSSLYTLFEYLWRVHESKRGDKYYTKDYLNLLKHPLIKNLQLAYNPAITRVMIHKIEEFLQGEVESSIGGSLFLTLSEIEEESGIYKATCDTLSNMDLKADTDICREILAYLHKLLFKIWDNISNFKEFTSAFEELFNFLIANSLILDYPLNIKVINKLQSVIEEFKSSSFCQENFDYYEIWSIFQQKLQSEKVSFIGSPLKGMQILGFLESRSLTFDNVIIMDLNEAVLPKLKIYEPLIPREVMLSLGLNRLEKEEEIQRYHFMRLVSSAKNAYLIYEENQEREKSRFIEELLWTRQKQLKELEALDILKASFSIKINLKQIEIIKSPSMIELLKKSTYSASRLNTYLSCPLEFYYRYVLGLKKREELLQDPDAPCIGNFIHQLLEEEFKIFIGKRPVINKEFTDKFFENMDVKFEKELTRRMRSDSFLLKKIVKDRMRKFLAEEKERDISKIISLETERRDTLELKGEPIEFVYTVDRVDEFKNGNIVVIDYKTGGSDIYPRSFTNLKNMSMTRAAIKENLRSFQLPLYYYFISKDFPERNLNAELYNILTLKRRPLISESDYGYREEIMKICFKALEAIYQEILDPEIPFKPDEEERRCLRCSFEGMCY